MNIFINDFAAISRLGMSRRETEESLTSSEPPRPDTRSLLNGGQYTITAALPGPFPVGLNGRTRTNQIIAAMADRLQECCEDLLSHYPAKRIGVVLGTSTTGIEEAIAPLQSRLETGEWKNDFRFSDQELGDPANFLKEYLKLEGTSYTVSTACTSGMKSIISGARMIQTGIADAVICGGADSLSRLTTNGFSSLDSVSPEPCLPFSANRRGINIGEGGALFVLSRDPGPWRLAGWGESSDAHHISSPEPSGIAAEKAVRQAFEKARLDAGDIGFVHMHGTATKLNDMMEATLVNRVFGADVPAASTKGMTGHTLGAAGAVQLAINLIAMDCGIYPPHIYDDDWDSSLQPIRLTRKQEVAERSVEHTLACCYAFGGSNAVVVAGRG
ncbi:beta-ketoacyl synthase N-terminal-like domain-containing protein [Henriciella sp.]|uniref:beta-ketoacyl synthase N-terminal-like domain-containing protein n=1 Tax=Henriciella sp. TaxID=1968823 RepID=UPI00261E069D|nr:beta-ketoacyl synthase N-terminal-like domain-containing protein [Henriciella sp.]